MECVQRHRLYLVVAEVESPDPSQAVEGRVGEAGQGQRVGHTQISTQEKKIDVNVFFDAYTVFFVHQKSLLMKYQNSLIWVLVAQ